MPNPYFSRAAKEKLPNQLKATSRSDANSSGQGASPPVGRQRANRLSAYPLIPPLA